MQISLEGGGWGGGGGGGYLFPCSPEINWPVPLFPQNKKNVFKYSLFLNIVSTVNSLIPETPKQVLWQTMKT